MLNILLFTVLGYFFYCVSTGIQFPLQNEDFPEGKVSSAVTTVNGGIGLRPRVFKSYRSDKRNPTGKLAIPAVPLNQQSGLAHSARPVSSPSDSLWLQLLPSFLNQQPKFKRLTPNDGLSQGHISSILKDQQGFMWFATDEVLNKYDGYTFTAYKHDPKKTSSLSHSFIRSLLEDQDGNFWVGTESGLDRFDRKQEAFIHYPLGSSPLILRNIFQDRKKRIWLGTSRGLHLFNAVDGTFKRYPFTKKDPNSLGHHIFNIVEDNEGYLWLSTPVGLNRFDPQTQQFAYYLHDPNKRNSIGSNWINTVYKDSKGRIWIGTRGGGIALFNPTKNSFINFRHDPANPNSVAHNDILSLVEDKDGKLWVGTETGGISVFDYAKNSFVNYQHDAMDPTSLSGNSIHSLYRDDIGNLWAGTWASGVNFLPRFRDKFAHYKQVANNNPGLSNNNVTAITGDRDGNIWMGTDGSGVNVLNRRQKTILHYRHEVNNTNSIKSDIVITATEVSEDIIAVGYHRVGFDLMNRKTGHITHLPEDDTSTVLPNQSVVEVYKDLWLGTYDGIGLFYYDRKNNRFTRHHHDRHDPHSINGDAVNALLEDQEGNLWVGTNAGLDYFDRKKNQFIHHQADTTNPYSISNDVIHSIVKDQRGNLWIGTGRGLNFFDKKTQRFTTYTEQEGLANNTIYGILEDQKGNLWLSSNKGISRFNPETKACRNYDVSDGLQDNVFNFNAWYKTPQGELFFGGINGFNVFHPDSVHDNPFVPPVRITGLQIFNQPVAIGKDALLQQHITQTREITLSYKESVFTLEFAALNYTQPEKNQYAYQLEGFDPDWNNIGTRRTATYTNLDAGTYTFRVKASNNDGVWNEEGTALIIHILPPWWKSWWFRSAAALLLAGMALTYYKIRVNTIKRQNKQLEKSVLERTRELKIANEEISEINKELVVREEEIQSQNDELYSRNNELVRRQEEIATQRDLLADQNQQLQEARTIIEAHNQTLDQEVKERTQELVDYNQQLEQFAFIAAHNLRAPVARILGLGQILELAKDNPQEEKLIVDKLIFTTEELDRVVKDINTVLVIRKNTVLTISEINLTEELQLIEDNLKNEIADTQAEIRADFTQVNMIHSVKPYLDSILLNLISNAIKYRQPGKNPCIQIRTETQNGYVCLSIKDNGLGIDLQHHQKQLFNLYKRFHAHVEGKGMGLYLVKTQVMALGGKIEVESQVNVGTTFKVFLKNSVIENAHPDS
jgi:ligand-binding sensor domain-containing protein/signal transduction histidine kinase